MLRTRLHAVWKSKHTNSSRSAPFPSDRTIIYFHFDSEPEINQGFEAQLLGELGESLAKTGRSDLVSGLRGNFLRKHPLNNGNYLLTFRCCKALVVDGISLSSILVDVAAGTRDFLRVQPERSDINAD